MVVNDHKDLHTIDFEIWIQTGQQCIFNWFIFNLMSAYELFLSNLMQWDVIVSFKEACLTSFGSTGSWPWSFKFPNLKPHQISEEYAYLVVLKEWNLVLIAPAFIFIVFYWGAGTEFDILKILNFWSFVPGNIDE